MKKLVIVFLFIVFLFSCQKKECWDCKVFFYDGQIVVENFTNMDTLIIISQDSTIRSICNETENGIRRYEEYVNKGPEPISACGRLRWTTCECDKI